MSHCWKNLLFSTPKHPHSGALVNIYMNDLFSPGHFLLCASCARNALENGGGVQHHATSQVSQHQGLGKTGLPNLLRARKRRKVAASFTCSPTHHLCLRTSGLPVFRAWGMEGTGGAEQKGGFPKDPPFHEIFLQNTTHCFTNCKTLFNHYR